MTTVPALPFTPSRAAYFNENDGLFHKKWTVKECDFLAENGLLTPGKFELLEGEIIYKMGQSIEHRVAITGIIATVSSVFDPLTVQPQGGIAIGDLDDFNDPEPDVAIYKETLRYYLNHTISPSKDILLVIEAAKSSLHSDRTTKARIYGKHGVQEYWIVAIEKRELIVYRTPNTTDGEYQDVQTYSETATISPLAKPDANIRIIDLLP